MKSESPAAQLAEKYQGRSDESIEAEKNLRFDAPDDVVFGDDEAWSLMDEMKRRRGEDLEEPLDVLIQ